MSNHPKITEPMRAALVSARDDGDATAHLRGRSAWGGWTWTRKAMIGLGLIDAQDRITPAGHAALTSPRVHRKANRR